MGSEKMDRLKLVKPSKEQEGEIINYIENFIPIIRELMVQVDYIDIKIVSENNASVGWKISP